MDIYCFECGKKIEEGSEFCSNCGTKVVIEDNKSNDETTNNKTIINNSTKTYEPEVIVRNEKNPGLAAVLSFLIIGLGQIYNGEIIKGLLLLIVAYVCIALFFLIIPLIIGIVLWIYAIFDAYNTAKAINQGIY